MKLSLFLKKEKPLVVYFYHYSILFISNIKLESFASAE